MFNTFRISDVVVLFVHGNVETELIVTSEEMNS